MREDISKNTRNQIDTVFKLLIGNGQIPIIDSSGRGKSIFEINDELCEEKQFNSIFKFLSYAMAMLRTAHVMDGVQIDKYECISK